MGLESSLSLAEIPPDARDAAQAAAHREGLPLGEWLTRRILTRYSELAAEDRDEAFHRLGNRITELTGRLDHFESGFHAESLREVIRRLHQGLERLTQDLLQAAGQSATQVSSVTRNLEDVVDRLDDLRTQMGRTSSGFDEQISSMWQGLNAVQIRQQETADALGVQKAHIDHGIQTLEERLEQSGRSLGGRVEFFSVRLDEVRAECSGTVVALDERVNELQRALDRIHVSQSDHARSVGGKLESLRGKLDEARNEAGDMCGALDHRLLLVQQRLQAFDADRIEAISQKLEQSATDTHQRLRSMDALYAERANTLAANIEALTRRLDEVRATSSAAAAELELRIATTRQALEGVDGRFNEISQSFAEVRQREEDQSASMLDLRESVSELKSRLAELAADNRYVALERSLGELTARTETAEAALASLKTKAGADDDLLANLKGQIESAAQTQDETFAELKANLLDQLSRSVAEKFEAENSKQQQAIADLKAGFAAQHPETREASPAPAAFAHEMPTYEAVAAPTAAHETHADDAPEHEIESLPPVVAGRPRDYVLQLEPPAHSTAAETEAPFDEAQAQDSVARGFGQEVLAASSSPATATTRDETRPQTGSGQTAFLSAARQSLQAAAESVETDAGTRDLLGLTFVRPAGTRESGKGETTSYALLAGVVLVAILAVAVTAWELISRSTPPTIAHPAQVAVVSLKPVRPTQTPARHTPTATVKPQQARIGNADTQRQLAVLANAGDSQAEMLLGLQQLGAPDKTQAVSWLTRAAASGEPVAQYRLGTLYADGRGVAADPAKALQWYSAAARGGNRKAMSNLALAYAQGNGAEKNPVEAARWFSKAAQLGLVDAQFDLAILYERGLGVPQSLMDAYRWYLIAAQSGDKESKDRTEALAPQLSPEDRAAAETAAAQFKPEPVNARANDPQ